MAAVYKKFLFLFFLLAAFFSFAGCGTLKEADQIKEYANALYSIPNDHLAALYNDITKSANTAEEQGEALQAAEQYFCENIAFPCSKKCQEQQWNSFFTELSFLFYQANWECELSDMEIDALKDSRYTLTAKLNIKKPSGEINEEVLTCSIMFDDSGKIDRWERQNNAAWTRLMLEATQK